MDLNQRKLTANEWNSIEKPISEDELRIVNMIKDAWEDVSLKRNNTMSLLQYLKVTNTPEIDQYVFVKYLQDTLKKSIKYSKRQPIPYVKVTEPKKAVSKRDIIRFKNTDSNLESYKNTLYEFILMDILKQTVKKREKKDKSWTVGYYTLHVMTTYSVSSCNSTLFAKIREILTVLEPETSIKDLVYCGQELIEKNPFLLKYADEELYEHQKKLITTFKNARGTPQLVLYIAPTGTGKTLSPLGLSMGYRIIFVCAARHVGLALAKAAISGGRKVAFAFGCNDAEDIRLHYSAAKDYVKNRRTGGIFRVDNSVGDKVEIMISDIKSYIPAMLYMCAFNKPENMITYWDEPTITMDYEEHECHEMIQRNWAQNKIPNVVLSSATLPYEHEMADTIMDFKANFEGASVTSIVSYDCKKTIPIIGRGGYVQVPHSLYDSYRDTKICAEYCQQHKTLMRYIDLGEAINFIRVVNEIFPQAISKNRYTLARNFPTLDHVNMASIKLYYLSLLANIHEPFWARIKSHLEGEKEVVHNSNVYISTKDANTLTDGPTIYLADDVDKIARFCLQSASIPKEELEIISQAIAFNAVINEKVAVLTKKLEDLTAADADKEKKMSDDKRGSPEVKDVRRKIDELQGKVKTIALPDKYIPNMAEHLKRFVPRCEHSDRVFKPNVTEDAVEKIMLIDDVEDHWKLLLMMGIGVFASHNSDRYTEVMKQLAQEQKLYLIIASTDYIYGTNYQFCHGYIGKDLGSMSQEKAIQAMGRVGRNKLQFQYSMRFRDNDIICKLFEHDDNKPEVRNMARLFNS